MPSWLPEYQGDDSSPGRGDILASLSSCHLNLHASCDFQNAQRWRIYHHHWRNPAPSGRCRGSKWSLRRRFAPPKEIPPPVELDRLGVNIDDLCTFAHRVPKQLTNVSEDEKGKRPKVGVDPVNHGSSSSSNVDLPPLFDQPVRFYGAAQPVPGPRSVDVPFSTR